MTFRDAGMKYVRGQERIEQKNSFFVEYLVLLSALVMAIQRARSLQHTLVSSIVEVMVILYTYQKM